MNNLDDFLAKLVYYSSGILFFVALISTVLGLINFKKIGIYKIFILLTSGAIIQTLFMGIVTNKYRDGEYLSLIKSSINYYLVFELIILSYFFYKKLIGRPQRLILYILNGSLIIFLLSTSILNLQLITYYYSEIAAVEAITILINCIFLFVQILNDEINASLLKSPDFIITSGIFFLFSFTCPFYVIDTKIDFDFSILKSCFSMVNYIGYVFFHLSIIKAFKCKIRLSKL